MKILCTGDWHVGAGPDYGNAPGERLRDQDQVIERIFELAREHDAELILHAGDVWERRRPTPEEIAVVERHFVQELGIPTVAITGNHCVEHADRATGLDVLAEAGLLTLHRTPGITMVNKIAVATLPWTPPGRLVATLNGGGDRDMVNRDVADLLLATARGLRAQVPDGVPAILLLHWSVSGASLPSGLPVDQLREPVLSSVDLDELGFDAVICGHIHRPQLLIAQEQNGAHTAAAFYVGSPMPLNFGEASVDHGVWILDTDTWRPEFVPIESRPFVTIEANGLALSTAGVMPPSDCLFTYDDEVAGAIVKVRYTATADQARRVDHAKIRQALYDAGAHKVYAIEATIERPQRARVEGLDEGIGPREAVQAYVAANEIDEDTAGLMQERTAGYLTEVAA